MTELRPRFALAWRRTSLHPADVARLRGSVRIEYRWRGWARSLTCAPVPQLVAGLGLALTGNQRVQTVRPG